MEKIVWVAYHRGKGFAKGAGGYDCTDDFSKARVYRQRNHLSSSVGKENIDSGEIIPIGLTLSLSDEDYLILKLGGNLVQ